MKLFKTHLDKKMGTVLGLIVVFIFCLSNAHAATNAQTFTYQGRFMNAAGTAPLNDHVDLTFSIYDQGGTCLLYQETQTNIDLTTTDGVFAVQVGSAVGATKRVAGVDPGLTMAAIFSNKGTLTGQGACSYTPLTGHVRKLKVTVTPQATGIATTLTPDQTINSVPQSQTAETLQGLDPTAFIQSASGVAGQSNVNLANLITLTGGGDVGSLHHHDGAYVKIGAGTPANLGTGAYTGGNFGISTTTPSADLAFGGSANRTILVERNSATNPGGSLTVEAGGAKSGASDQTGGTLVLSGGVATGSAGSDILFKTATGGASGSTDRAASTKMVLTSSGKLGVGALVPNAQLEVDSSGTGVIGAIIKLFAGQTADSLQIQDSAGTVLSKFDAAGYLSLPGDPTSALQACTKQYVDNAIGGLATGVTSFNTRTGAVTLSSADVTTALTYTPLKNTSDTITAAAAGQVGLVVKGAASQTGDLLQFQNSAAGVLSKFNKDGVLTLASDPTAALEAATKQYVDTAVATKQGTGNYITALTGDVTASGPGSVAATVASVGGSSAANLHAAELLANAATDANTNSAIVKRDASGNFSAGMITANLTGAVTGAASSNVLKAGDTMTGALAINSGSITSSAPAFNTTQTWNNAGTTFTGILQNITDTASNAASKLIDLQVGGVSKFSVDKTGKVTGDGSGLTNISGAISGMTAGSVPFATNATTLSQDNSNFFWDNTNKRLGIGSATPSAALEIKGAGQAVNGSWTDGGSTASTILLRDTTSAANSDKGGQILFGTGQGNFAYISGGISGSAGPEGNLNFGTRTNGGSITNRMRIDNLGNIGIGTGASVPGARLDVQTTLVSTSGTDYGMKLSPTINQTSGTAGYTGLLINSTETATGSGTKLLADFQVGGVSKFKVDNAGNITTAGTINNTGTVTTTTDFKAANGLINSTNSSLGFKFPDTSTATITTSGSTAFSAGNAADTVLQSGGTGKSVVVRALASQTADFLDVQNSAGTSKFKVDANGNVGIGVASPVEKLDVSGGAIRAGTATSTNGSTLLVDNYSPGNISTIGTEYSTGGLVLGYGVTPSTSASASFVSSDPLAISRSAVNLSGDTIKFFRGASQTVAIGSPVTMVETMRIDNIGNVGIGTASPSAVLEVIKNNSNNNAYEIAHFGKVQAANDYGGLLTFLGGASGTSTRGFLGFTHTGSGGATAFTGELADAMAFRSEGGMQFGTNGNNIRMTLDTSGNLGLGTSSPSTTLHVSAATNSKIRLEDTTSTGTLELYQGTNSYVTAKNALYFGVNNTLANSMTMLANGNVGIGTASPSDKLSVVGSSNTYVEVGSTGTNAADRGIRFTDSAGTSAGYITLVPNTTNTNSSMQFYVGGGAGSNIKMTMLNSGNVGVGTTTPVVPLQVHSSAADTYFHITNAGTGSTVSDGLELSASSTGNSNLWNYENGYIRFATNNTERVRLDAAGNFGIGTSSPTATLDVGGIFKVDNTNRTIRNDNLISYNGTMVTNDNWPLCTSPAKIYTLGTINSNGGGYEQYIEVEIYGSHRGYNTTNYIEHKKFIMHVGDKISSNTIESSGGSFVHLWDGTNPGDYNNITATGFNFALIVNPACGSSRYYTVNVKYTSGLNITPGGTAGSRFTGVDHSTTVTLPDPAIHINGSSVGIGTSSPVMPLSVNGSVQSLTAGSDVVGTNGFYIGNATAGTMLRHTASRHFAIDTFSTGGAWTERVRVDRDGNVGIGTNSPTSKLDVAGSMRTVTGAGAFFNIDVTGWGNAGALFATSTGDLHFKAYSAGFATDQLFLKSGGSVGIGTTSPSYTLHVNGSVAGTSAYNNLSDVRLKTNIKPLASSMDKLEKLNGITYQWKDPVKMKDDRVQIGFIAQDVQKVFPEAVHQQNDGFFSVAYSMIIPPVVEALKELNQKVKKIFENDQKQDRSIASLESKESEKDKEIAALKAKNEELEKRLERLEKKLK